MAKFCGKCGSKLDETTGLCLNCDTVIDKPLSKKDKWKQKKIRRFFLKTVLFILLLAALGTGVVGILVYFEVVDITYIQRIFRKSVGYVESVERDLPETQSNSFSYYSATLDNIVCDDDTGITFINNELLVSLNAFGKKKELESYLTTINGTIVGEIPELADYQILLNKEYTYSQLLDLAEEIQNQSWSDEVTVNYTIQMDTQYIPNDKKWRNKWGEVPEGINWGVEAIDADEAWEHRDLMKTVNIGIIDDMFDTTHEDINFAEQPLGIMAVYAALERGDFEWSNHGTHTSGTIAAAFDNETGITGIAVSNNLYGVSMRGLELTDCVSLQAWKIALYYLISAKKCSVINCSLGYDLLTFDASRKGEVSTLQLKKLADGIGDFLEKLVNIGYKSFVICKSAGNQNEVNGDYKYFRKNLDDNNYKYEYYSYNSYLEYLEGKNKSNNFKPY